MMGCMVVGVCKLLFELNLSASQFSMCHGVIEHPHLFLQVSATWEAAIFDNWLLLHGLLNGLLQLPGSFLLHSQNVADTLQALGSPELIVNDDKIRMCFLQL